MRKWLLFSLTVVAVGVLGSTCAPPDGGSDTREAALKAFKSADEMRSYMASQATAPYRNSTSGIEGFFGWITPTAADQATGGATNADSEGGGDTATYSTTNVQEAGVDESDVVKNDGNYIYTLSGDKIHVVKAAPVEEAAEVATIEVESGGQELYLREGEIVAISSSGYCYVNDFWWARMGGIAGGVEVDSAAASAKSAKVVSARMTESMNGPWFDGASTTVSIIDVTDPANPVSKKTIRFEGSLASSRLIGDKLHLVLTTMPVLSDSSEEGIDTTTLEEWLPDVQVMVGNGEVQTSDAVSWENTLYPAESNGYAMTLVASVDLADMDAAIATTAVTANVGIIYASTEALYLTDTQYNYDDFSSRSDTIVHKLAFTDAGTDYVASGLVPGRPLSQYSISEYQDYLRLATTSEEYNLTGESISSGVYVLGVNGSSLDVVGKIENIAPGETIYAARFLGDRGFLVTFKRIDPLFTMDLSDPTKPTIVGKLKVPGYSDHIQLLDANHLLTIGRNAQEDGEFAWVQGVLLTIFDITDLANPQILKIGDAEARVEIGGRGTYSEANGDPKAFNYYAAKNVLAFPVDLYEGDTTGAEYGTHAFTGLYVYRVTVENGFEFLGRIESTTQDAEDDACYSAYYGSTRGVFIGNNVYSVTGLGVKAASLDDVGTLLANTEFADQDGLYNECDWYEPDLLLPASEDLQ